MAEGIRGFSTTISRWIGVPTVIYLDEVGLGSVAPLDIYKPFCKLVWSMAQLGPLCHKDHEARALTSGAVSINLCHAGLWNVAIPIVDDGGKRFGCILSGQQHIATETEQESRQFQVFLQNAAGKASEEELKSLRQAFEANLDSVGCKEELDRPELSSVACSIGRLGPRLFRALISDLLGESNVANRAIAAMHELGAIVQPFSHTLNRYRVFLADLARNCSDVCEDKADLHTKISDMQTETERLLRFMQLHRNYLQNYESLASLAPDLPLGEVRPVDLAKLIDDILGLLEDDLSNKGLGVEKRYGVGESYWVFCNESQVRRLIINLIHNSIKYSYSTSEEGERYIKIVIRRHSKDQDHLIVVSNYGVGILQAEIQNVFKLGYRGLLARQERVYGGGVGLFECKRIVTAHKGRIRIDSKHLHGHTYKVEVSVNLPHDPRRL